jgi:lipoprotein-anchoring transpeptidase ErfK/SrfK
MKIKMALALALLFLAACSRQEVQQKTETVKEKVQEAWDDVAVPIGSREDPKERERQRFDEGWRGLRSFRELQAQRAAQQKAQQQRELKLQFVTGVKESLKGLTVPAINAAPIAVPITGDVSGPSVIKAQVYLDRLNFSVGVLDGRWGRNSAISLFWYQRSRGLEPTGAADEQTFRQLAAEVGGVEAVSTRQLTEEDVKGPFVDIPDDVYEQAKLDCLCYESLPEKLAERFHTTVEFLELLNPNVKLTEVRAGTSLNVPNVRDAGATHQHDIARIVVSIAGNTFNAYDAAGNLIFHAPTTLGSKYDPSPRESTSVVKITEDPWFHYQPKLFSEVPDDEPEANLKPGPNSPVGVVWIALKKPHFGIHGTSDPDAIGYASSHGCVRLTNWDALEVARRLAPDAPVEFIDTRRG